MEASAGRAGADGVLRSEERRPRDRGERRSAKSGAACPGCSDIAGAVSEEAGEAEEREEEKRPVSDETEVEGRAGVPGQWAVAAGAVRVCACMRDRQMDG